MTRELRWHIHETAPGVAYAVSPDHLEQIGPMSRREAEEEAAYHQHSLTVAAYSLMAAKGGRR